MSARAASGSGAAVETDVALVRRTLGKLDPWSFWVVPSEEGGVLDFSVVGTTGAFAVTTCALEGYVKPAPIGVAVGKRSVRGLWRVRWEARKLRSRLTAAVFDVPVEPVVCLTRARSGGPRTVQGVRVVGVDDLAADIANRSKIAEANRAQRAAESLQKVAAGR
jgi:hypothetical protein